MSLDVVIVRNVLKISRIAALWLDLCQPVPERAGGRLARTAGWVAVGDPLEQGSKLHREIPKAQRVHGLPHRLEMILDSGQYLQAKAVHRRFPHAQVIDSRV